MRKLGFLAVAAGLAACTTTPTEAPPTSYSSAIEALSVYYRSIPASALPQGPTLLKPDPDKALTRIVFASCNDEELPDPALMSIAQEDADLFLFIGDNVYGDRDGRNYANADAELVELRETGRL